MALLLSIDNTETLNLSLNLSLSLVLPWKLKYDSLLIASKATHFNERITRCSNDSKAISKIIEDLPYRYKMPKLPAYSSSPDLANKCATFFKEKIDKIIDELFDCSDIHLNITQDKPTSTLKLSTNHDTGGGMEEYV